MGCATPSFARACTARSLVALLALLCVLGSCKARGPSPEELLHQAWQSYKALYVTPEGYVLDRTRGSGEVVSEGQGYALLRAVWMCDESTFDRVLDWTQHHLSRPDGLFSWRWSPATQSVLDANSASDADQEIAFSLVLAAHAFERPELLGPAAALLRAIREHESIEVGEGWFPAAGNWAVVERIVDLSYFLPYAYTDFARVDPASRWDLALDTGYRLIRATMLRPGIELPPDFMVVGADGTIEPLPPSSELSRDFSFDAMRLYFRVALDCSLYPRPQACDDPLHAGRLARLLQRDGAIFTRYSVEGRPLADDESLSFYGSVLPAFERSAPAQAQALRDGLLSARSLTPVLDAPDRYYDLNWIWFGLAAADGLIAERQGKTCPTAGRGRPADGRGAGLAPRSLELPRTSVPGLAVSGAGSRGAATA